MQRDETNQIQEGTVVQATLRTDDLLEAFSDELHRLDPWRAKVIRNAYPDPYAWLESRRKYRPNSRLDFFGDAPEKIAEEASFLVNEVLPEALDSHAPQGMHFGVLEGDASDFGFWYTERE